MERDTRKKSFVSGILLSIALYFMIFFFAPIDVFLSDQREFIIPARHIIFPMLVTAVAAVTVSVLVLYCIYRANKKVYDIVICLMLGLLLSFYCQELFMNGYMKSIVGNIYIYSEPLLEYKINFVINDIIFFAPLILWLVGKNYPNLKALSFADDKAVNYICAIVFIMQASGTVGIFAQNGIYNNKPDGEIEYLSYKPAMSLSKDKNVIVFLTDRLDSLWLDSTIEKYPELNEVFDGFTFYRNNISEYTNTFPSVANLLTDVEYEGESWTGYFDKAWAENNETLPDILKKNGYNVNLLIEKSTGYGELKNLNGRCDNAVKTNADVKYNYLEKEGIVRTMTRLSFGKLTPYIFKDFF
ncbi:MAG: hypothetical protein IJR59_00385, partial [Firmicutes bacterium]|nr:hypothetical protein [Bacillota bacterium]